MNPASISDANYVLITHEHRDHCDLDTLLPLSKASPNCKFICPNVVKSMLIESGISEHRVIVAKQNTNIDLDGIEINILPSAHPEIEFDEAGCWKFVGFLISSLHGTLYHPGDTSITDELADRLKSSGKINVAFLPVNERNYFREKQGIIGNMSIRDAFQLAEDLEIDKIVPTHWDMFPTNQVYRKEIETVYNNLSANFELVFYPNQV